MRPHFLLSTLLIVVGLGPVVAQQPSPASFGQAEPLTNGWLFMLADDSAAISPAFDDSRWQRVSVPHDWSVHQPMSPDCGSCQGYLPGGIAWYRRHLSATDLTAVAGRRLFIFFEGVYNRSTVYVNGHRLGYRPSGFASFMYDLTPYLRAGEDNVIAVRVDHSRQNDSRWYTGSGIYRPVWLISAPDVHFAQWGTSWRVKQLSNNKAEVIVTVDTTSEAPASVKGKRTCIVEIRDASGRVVAQQKTGISAQERKNIVLTVSHPIYWNLNSPYLYNIRARLLDNGRETDVSSIPIGFRVMQFSSDQGFILNGVNTKVKGVCLHDDAGVLGTAVPPEVWKRRLQKLKQLGVNAIRMSHNPHAPALYDLCDTLGLLVMDEASDEWEFPKRKWLKGWNRGTPGYEGTFDYFEEWIDRDVADMVRRDRCHPSIFLWSIGNEVDYPNDPYSHPVLDGNGTDFTQPVYGGYKPEQPNAERIGIIAKRLAKIVRDIDDTRAVTGALAGVVMSNETAYPEAVDVVGYNYTESRYAEDHRRYPSRVIYGSENRHDLAAWKAVRDNPHIFGQFLWTGIDYLGESGPWPARGSEAGLLDLAGNIKPLGHYRASLWSEKPVCYIGTYPSYRSRHFSAAAPTRGPQGASPYAPAVWNYDEGQRVRVVCYTNAATARLFLNDLPIGGEPTRDPATDILYWDIDYQPGTLRCEADNGTTASVATCGRPFALRATLDNRSSSSSPHFSAAPPSLAHIVIEVVDEDGNLVPLADNEVTCFVQGPARLLGLENGDIRDISDKNDNRCRAHAGRLLAYIDLSKQSSTTRSNPFVNSNNQSSTIQIRFTSPLLQSTEILTESFK